MDPTREPTVNLLCSKDFHPEKYVRDLSQSCVGGPELRRLRKNIQALSEETNNNLKKNVYHNYMQFIDTAKEISHLESEMYQLSHLLSEQKSLLSSLATTSILGDDTCIKTEVEAKETSSNSPNKDKDDDQENKNKIASILEKVENCKELLEITSRKYLYEGDLLEIDPVDNNIMKTVHAYLFTDSLMITCRNANNRSLMKYVFEVMYDLGSLAVVNVRDMGSTKHAFKLLIFPDTRVFQCTSNSNKKEWLDKFDQAKKARLTQEQQKRESIVEKSPSRAASIDSPSFNPFEEYEEETGTIHPEWFLEIPEELDVCIAQRHFEDALTLLQKSKDYINNQQQLDQILIDIQRKIEQRRNNLIDVLLKELELNPDKSLQGGLRATRRTIRLLNQLNCSQQSCELFLKLCSSMLKQQCKRVKREGSTFIYIKYLSSVVFTNLCHMTEEFLRAFQNSSTCLSAYIVWISCELSLFIAHFIKQVFMPQTTLSTITDCVVLVREQCERLCTYGVDLCYQVDGMLRTPLIQSLKDARDKFVDSIKLRSIEDKWIPMNLRTKANLTKFLNEYSQLGLNNLHNYISGDVWLQLTVNTLSFTKLYLQLLDDCLKLQTIELIHVIDDILYDVFETQIKHIEQSLRNEHLSEQRQFLTKNAEFLLVTLIELCQKKYKEINNFECRSLEKLQKEYRAVTKGVTPTNRNITKKYSSEFL